MPIPKPRPTENRSDFIKRCMADSVMVSDFEDASQRMAVCSETWRNKNTEGAMEFKQTGDIKELSEKGEGVAIIATLNVVDADKDVTLPGAFGEQIVPMVPAHEWKQTPIGKATIIESGDEVLAKFKLNLKNKLAQDWYSALKFDLENPPSKQQYSYGYSILKDGSEDGEFEEQDVRFLKRLKVHEMSPVLVGAGIGTGTVILKNDSDKPIKLIKIEDQILAANKDIEELIERVKKLQVIRVKEGRTISKERIKELLDLKKLMNDLDELLNTVSNEKATKALMTFYELQNKILDFKKTLL